MTSLLSMTLFGHCAAEPDPPSASDSTQACSNLSGPGINPTTLLPIASGTAIDVAGTLIGGGDTINDSLSSSNGLGEHSSLASMTTNDCGQPNHDDSGFILSDDGGMVTFDNNSGAADWGFDDGISMNSGDGF